MLKILGGVAAVFVLAVVFVVAIAVGKPDHFRVTRSIVINAPPEAVYVHLDDFRSWRAWSPYEKMDPAMAREYAGPVSGRGAAYAWESEKAGTGRMEILQADPARQLLIKLDFIKPFEASNTATFTLAPKGQATTVTWTMDGPMPLISKIMSVFMSLDTMIGKDFEAGLRDLKAVSESPATPTE